MDRWGRVTTEGIPLPLKLTHGFLASLVCMRRPSVSAALVALARDGALRRNADRVENIAPTAQTFSPYPLQDFVGAAREIGLPEQQRSHRADDRGPLSLGWTDLTELDPDRMRRAHGTNAATTSSPTAGKSSPASRATTGGVRDGLHETIEPSPLPSMT